jgi:hypothetical protein
MPAISRFFGIVISMYHKDHLYPHFHARYGENEISVDIRTGSITGRFPPNASRLVREWLNLHRIELMENWRLAGTHQLLNPIAPLE